MIKKFYYFKKIEKGSTKDIIFPERGSEQAILNKPYADTEVVLLKGVEYKIIDLYGKYIPGIEMDIFFQINKYQMIDRVATAYVASNRVSNGNLSDIAIMYGKSYYAHFVDMLMNDYPVKSEDSVVGKNEKF